VASRVSAVDLAPTLLELAGVAAPTATQGQSLLTLISATRPADRPAYAETDYPRRAFGWSSLAAWRVDRFLYVKAPRRELYDTAADPAAARNLAAERAPLADGVARSLEEFRTRTAAGGDRGAPVPAVDPALAEKLAALGYLSTGAAAPSASGIDPKDKVAVANTLHDAILSLENGDTARAGTLLERVIATDPQIPMAQLQLGVARCRERRYAQAIAPLRRAIELQPDAVMAHYEMGIALFETGDWKTAAGHFEIVAARMPKFADARFSLGSVYARIDRVDDAVAELKAALELEPRHYRANLLLGRLLTLRGQAEPAVPYLKQAAEAQPSSVEAQSFLADAYQALGRTAEAAQARARAQQLKKP
jgi:tetratricopeptide (TPR) repeat protein